MLSVMGVADLAADVTLTIRLLLLNSDFSILQFVHRSVKVRSKAPSHRNSLLYV